MSDTNNKNPIQIYYLCNDTDSDTDSNCKKLIEMINVIVLNELLKNKKNNIAEPVIKAEIKELTNKLIVPPMTKKEYEKYTNMTEKKIIEKEKKYIANMAMNNMTNMNGMDGMDGMDGMEYGMNGMNGMNIMQHHTPDMQNIQHMSHMSHMPHMSHIPKGGKILTKKSYTYKKQQRHQKTKNHKKSKMIRKI